LRHDAEAKVAAPAGFNIEEAARGLYDFVELVLLKTGAPAIYLVAHSMGGLIARCMIQKISQQYDEAAQRQRTPANQLVRKLFTFGTPHGGIQFEIAALDWAMETFGPAGGDIFSPRLMYGYLDKDANWGDEAPDGWDPRVIPPELFDTSSVFCLVGTDPADYGAPRVVVGPKSDGLVDITNAYVRGANRSFVHRSHSGRYGEVNSEEGYQNLRRFLFGNYRVAVDLRGITLPDRQDGRVWQADVRLSVRGLPIVMHEQQAAHYCPIQLAEEIERHHDTADAPVPLTTVFLLDPNRAVGYGDADRPPRARYSLSMRVYHLTEVSGGFLWRHHLEQVADWEDTLIVDVGRRDDDPETALRAWTAWNSAVAGAIDDYDPIANALPEDQRADAHFTADGGEMHAEVALPAVAAPILGQAAKLRLTVTRVGEFVAPAQPGN
jgi:pimeloyl-ACP methyl ester carboxylesterase